MTAKRRSFKPRMFGTEMHESIYGVQEWNLDVRQFSLYLTGERMEYNAADDWEKREEPGVEYQMSARLIKNLNILSDIDPKRPILIHMKTNGGDWNEGMAMYDAIRFAQNPVVLLNYTHARSMSSIFFQAARKRVMMPHSNFMFHEGTVAYAGTSKQFYSYAEFSKRDNSIMKEIYAIRMKEKGIHSKKSKKEIKAILQGYMDRKEDVYLTSREAVAWGLADEIFDGNWQKLRQRLGK